jgi:hypothetical protein
MMQRTRVRLVGCLALFLTLMLAACGAPPPASTSAPPASAAPAQATATPAPVLSDLHAPDDLKVHFNQDAGVPRIILLLSPT